MNLTWVALKTLALQSAASSFDTRCVKMSCQRCWSTSQSAISRHLAIVRSAGVVLAEHQRQNVYYRAANQKLLGVCDLMREGLEEQSVHEAKLAQEL